MSSLQPQIFDLAEKRLHWASERQAVLARNIANLSTPGFLARDLPDFKQVLGGTVGIKPVLTDPRHIAGTIDTTVESSRETSVRTLDKNGDRMEEQLMKVADTELLHTTVAAIFKSYTTMFNIALGKAS